MGKDDGGTKRKKGLFALFAGKNAEENEIAQEALAQEAEASAAQPEGEGADAQEQEVLETICPAKDSQLYEVYCRINGLPPLAEDAVFDTSMFLMEGLAPSEELLGIIKGLDKKAYAMMRRWNDAEMEPVDAQPVLLVSKDRMRVYLFAFPAMFGGQDMSPESLAELLEKDSITFGINKEVLAMAGEGKAYMQLFLLASGLPAVDGMDGQVLDHYTRGWEMRLTVRDDNTIDYRDLRWLQTVHVDDVICDITPPSKAASGFDVYNREVPGKDGRTAKAPSGQGTALNEEGTKLLATADGVVSFHNERFRVEALLIIDGNVDNAVGHLDVVGDVLIKGDVQEGFRVKATGGIIVNGGVEGADIKAGGSVQIGLGMNGNSVGSIHAGKEVYSKFFENTTVWSGSTIVCDTIINSDIASEGEVLVTTGRGAVIGGSITALHRVAAITIGNQSNRAMEITLGNTNDYLKQRKALEDARFAQAAHIQELEKNVAFLERQIDTPVKREKLNETNLQLKMGRLKFSKMEREYQVLLEREVDIGKCRLQAEVLYPPLSITVGTTVKNIRENVFNALVYYKDGEIRVANV